MNKIVNEHYSKVAKESGCRCCCSSKKAVDISKSIGYSEDEVDSFSDANLGLGCGNPTAMAELKEGMMVVDFGSGAGFDAFIAARRVGESGKVIGIDMTDEMLAKARKNAEKYGFSNVEFRKGDIEDVPIEDSSVDAIISNCVINLAPDKKKVFMEGFRILRSGGSMYVSDIVLLEPLDDEKKKDEKLLAGCVAGAILRDEYISIIEECGFSVEILDENKDISKEQYEGVALESLKIKAVKE